MKTNLRIFFIALCSLFFALSLQAQSSYRPKTGDIKFDAQLNDLNIEARANLDGYLNDLATQHHVPVRELKRMMIEIKMEPADLYLAIRVSELGKVPLHTVEREYRQNRNRGWGVMARNLGIKPGSSEFHELKRIRLKKRKQHRGPPKKEKKRYKERHGDDDHDDHDDDHDGHDDDDDRDRKRKRR